MSAYIVDREHIVYLVQAAVSNRLSQHDGGSITWEDNDQWVTLRTTATPEELAVVGNMLWAENVKSVSYRYNGESLATLPGNIADNKAGCILTASDFGRPSGHIDPVQVLKSCHCYEYQTCEHPAWKESAARRFIEGLIRKACHSLIGYEEAEWGGPKTQAEIEYTAKAKAEMKANRKPELSIVR